MPHGIPAAPADRLLRPDGQALQAATRPAGSS